MEEKIAADNCSASLQVQPKRADGAGQARIFKAVIVGFRKENTLF